MKNRTQPPPHVDITLRLTALWALSEAGLAGILHAFRVPFTGMVIGSVAVLFITLIYLFDQQKGAVLKAALVVMVVKAVVSPHTPVNAYFAVAFQALTAVFLFRIIKKTGPAVFLLAVLAMFEAALQKLLILTLVFGQTLWDSLNLFGHFVLSQFLLPGSAIESINLSLFLIVIYTGIHVAAGIYAGIKIPRIARYLLQQVQNARIRPEPISKTFLGATPKKKGKRWQKRITLFLLFAASGTIFVGSYFFTFFEKSQGAAALIMLVRSIAIMFAWYFFISPLAMRLLHRYLKRKQSFYSLEIQNILHIFPYLKAVVQQSWTDSSSYKKSRRLSLFIERVLVTILTMDIEI